MQKNSGNDRRILVGKPFEHPWRLTGYLESSTPKAKFVGSGLLVGKRCVITAGHCLYSEGIGINFARFFPGRHGSFVLWQSLHAEIFLHPKWYKEYDDHYDLGMVVLEDDLGDKLGWAEMHAPTEEEILKSPLRISGYPYEKQKENEPYMYTMHGVAQSVKPHKFYYDIDTSAGQSGSGVCLEDGKNFPTSIGVHVTGCQVEGNSAVRFDKEKLEIIKKWIKLAETIH